MLDVLNLPKPQNGYIDYFSGSHVPVGISSSWQTWEKPRGISMIHITCFGGGGGGGPGLGGAFGQGGGGGGSGGQSTVIIPAHVLPDVLYVIPGKGGRGAGFGVISTNGTASYVSIAPSTDGIYVVCVANGGSGSLQGNAGAGGALANTIIAVSHGFSSVLAGQGGSSGSSAALRNVTYPTTGLLVSGGAGGGGGNSSRGGNGGFVIAPTYTSFALVPSRNGGAEGTGNPGEDGISLFQPLMSIGGAGGSGQGGSANAIVGNGGNGGFGSGGGGLGVLTTGSAVGKTAGNGGDGLVVIQCF